MATFAKSWRREFNEQIFGADKQVPAGLVQKMHSGRGNSVSDKRRVRPDP
jgi:hypothetical protein